MNPTPQEIELIRDHVIDWTPSDADIATALNNDIVLNPSPAPLVPVVLEKLAALAVVKDANKPKVANFPNLSICYDAFDAQDHASAVKSVYLLRAAGAIDSEDAAAAIAYITTPVPDPAWQATVPAPVVWLGRELDAGDVHAARIAPVLSHLDTLITGMTQQVNDMNALRGQIESGAVNVSDVDLSGFES